MVVLSAAICTKSGKALISRQFVDMTRIRIEGLLAAFSKLLGSDSKQHTYIETDSVRYLYQPLDVLYILLITNRASNIIEDLETLRLLSKVVPDALGSANNLSEEKIAEKSFELIFSLDEVITTGGYKESITLQQIRTNLEMESHEEKLHLMIQQSKIESAKDQARDAARIIRERQREQQRTGLVSTMQGIGSSNNEETSSTPSDFRSDNPSTTYTSSSITTSPVASSQPVKKAAPVKGMSLVSGNKSKSLEDALVKEDKLAPIIKSVAKTSHNEVTAPVVSAITYPIMLSIIEKVSATISREGLVESFEIKGSLTLTATSEDASFCSVKLNQGNVDAFAFSTHPKVNKALYDKSAVLQLKNSSTGFPTARPLAIVKWSLINGNEQFLPIKINCWPEEESRGQINVSIEYSLEHDITLHDVKIKIPLGTSDVPNILNIDGNFKHSPAANELVWEIDLIDSSNASGSLEFMISQKSVDVFFPIHVSFQSNELFCDLEVSGVSTIADNKAIPYGIEKNMSSEEYFIIG